VPGTTAVTSRATQVTVYATAGGNLRWWGECPRGADCIARANDNGGPV